MLKSKFISDISKRIADALPKELKTVKHDLETTVKGCANKSLEKFNLVTRDEFDAQATLLKKLKKKVADLEKHIQELESKK